MVGKYDKAIANRRAADVTREMRERERQARIDAEAEAERQRLRAEDAVWKAEYAYEVIRAIMDELRRGQHVSKSSLTNAFQRLEEIPDHIRKSLLPPDVRLDRELRKDDPKGR